MQSHSRRSARGCEWTTIATEEGRGDTEHWRFPGRPIRRWASKVGSNRAADRQSTDEFVRSFSDQADHHGPRRAGQRRPIRSQQAAAHQPLRRPGVRRAATARAVPLRHLTLCDESHPCPTSRVTPAQLTFRGQLAVAGRQPLLGEASLSSQEQVVGVERAARHSPAP